MCWSRTARTYGVRAAPGESGWGPDDHHTIRSTGPRGRAAARPRRTAARAGRGGAARDVPAGRRDVRVHPGGQGLTRRRPRPRAARDQHPVRGHHRTRGPVPARGPAARPVRRAHRRGVRRTAGGTAALGDEPRRRGAHRLGRRRNRPPQAGRRPRPGGRAGCAREAAVHRRGGLGALRPHRRTRHGGRGRPPCGRPRPAAGREVRRQPALPTRHRTGPGARNPVPRGLLRRPDLPAPGTGQAPRERRRPAGTRGRRRLRRPYLRPARGRRTVVVALRRPARHRRRGLPRLQRPPARDGPDRPVRPGRRGRHRLRQGDPPRAALDDRGARTRRTRRHPAGADDPRGTRCHLAQGLPR